MQNKMLTGSGIKVKALEDGSVYLEGFANKSVVDRGRDLIGKKAWKLDDYKKNSIILFNHDHTKPIGKMLSVEAMDEGLFVKGRISNSKDPEISRIRDLVKEGILNSLSVGFMAGDEEIKDGVNVIKSANLHEVSIVAVPMNQDSQFSVTTKTMGSGTIIDSISQLADWKGFVDVHKAVHLFEGVASMQTVHDLAKKMAEACQVSEEEAIQFLRMENKEVPANIKAWIEKQEAACDDSEKEKAAPALPDGSGVFTILVPADQFATQDEAAQWASDSGWDSGNISRNDVTGTWVIQQADAAQFEGEMDTIDLGDGVTAQIGKLVKDKAEMQPEEEGMEPAEEEEDGAKVEIEIETEDKSLLDGTNPTTAVTGNDASDSEVNPYLDQSKQTNVLLGNMILLLQQMNETLSGLVSKPEMVSSAAEPPPIPPVPEMTPEEEDMTKSLNLFLMKTGERLAKLGL